MNNVIITNVKRDATQGVWVSSCLSQFTDEAAEALSAYRPHELRTRPRIRASNCLLGQRQLPGRDALSFLSPTVTDKAS